MGIDLVRRAQYRHFLAVGFRSSGVVVGGDGGRIGRLAQRDPLAVGAQHHDLRARRRRRRPPRGFVAGHRPGQGPGHRLQAGHRWLQPEHPLQHRVDWVKGGFHDQGLIPVPQHVGTLPLGQSQPRIQQRRLHPLAFPRPVHHPLQGKIPEDRPIRPAVGFGPALHHPPAGQLQRFTAVAIACQGKIVRLQRMTQPQQGVPQAAFPFVRRQAVPRGVGHESRQLRYARRHIQPLAFHGQRRHHRHRWVPRGMAFSMTSIDPRPSPPGQAPTALFVSNPVRRLPRARRVTPVPNAPLITILYLKLAVC